MFSVETGQMSAVETGQMSAAQMSAVETRQIWLAEAATAADLAQEVQSGLRRLRQ